MASIAHKQRVIWRKRAIQAAFLIIAVAVIWGAISNARTNLDALGLASGFGFLERSTGWSYSFSLIDRSPDDSYLRTLTIGLLNTLFVGLTSIVLATILGFIVGTARDARNLAPKTAASVFVQVFRNIPLILQLVFWYAILIHLPAPRQAVSVGDTFFLSNRGIMVPVLNIPLWLGAAMLLFVLALAFVLWRFFKLRASIGILLWLIVSVAVCWVVARVFVETGESLLSVPELQGLRFNGGMTISMELTAMMVAIVLYGSAYIAEVVRGGLEEVPKGLIEAGQALGLSHAAIWVRIKMPMALRTIIPPVGNQWIFIMKATTIGVAIGFSDLFMLVSTSITQSGQTLELIAILMGSFLVINYALAQFINLLNARLQLKAH